MVHPARLMGGTPLAGPDGRAAVAAMVTRRNALGMTRPEFAIALGVQLPWVQGRESGRIVLTDTEAAWVITVGKPGFQPVKARRRRRAEMQPEAFTTLPRHVRSFADIPELCQCRWALVITGGRPDGWRRMAPAGGCLIVHDHARRVAA